MVVAVDADVLFWFLSVLVRCPLVAVLCNQRHTETPGSLRFS